VAELEPVVDAADRLGGAEAGADRPERRQGAARRATGQVDVRRGGAAQADVDMLVGMRLARDVEARPPATDQLQLTVQRREFVGARFPRQAAGLAQDAAGL